MEVKSVNFIPRLTAPSAADKHYLHTSKGGSNECIHIGGGSCLPNCVGYAWGRFYEITGERPRLSRANAEMWYGFTADGYERSQTPTLGAVVCWSKGAVGNEADGAGHVAIVERIEANGDIVTSNSAYGGTSFYIKTYEKKNGYNFGAYKFQGFILPPVQIKNNMPTSKPTDTNAVKIGDIVDFTGSMQYGSSTAAAGTAARPGKAKITNIVVGAKHPYHVIHTDSTSNVYGWVNEGDIASVNASGTAAKKKSVEEVALEVIAGKWGNGEERKKALISAGYVYSDVQNKVNELTR